jgi:hypothetical protein
MSFLVLFILLLQQHIIGVIGDCSMHNYCNGHGTCLTATSVCVCYEGYGASTDITHYRAADCSARTCPNGLAWADVPTDSSTAHARAECSNRGTCDRSTGECTCFTGFTGAACDRSKCPNDCSGHGTCVSIKQMARMTNALPLGANTYYEGGNKTWDEDMSFGCVCDSKWTVGLGSGETQVPEWFGPDCSLRHCPSGDDPRTEADETDCEDVTADGSTSVGASGNLCHIDCSNRGLCDYSTGTCQCFNGYYGSKCDQTDTRAVYEVWNSHT